MTKHIPVKNRSAVFHLLVHVAAADGEVAPEELKMLRKIARGLELEPDTAVQILRDDVAFREITVADAKPSNRQGEAIPAKPEERPVGLQLDMARIAALTKETHEVVSMLAAVMVEEEVPAPPSQIAQATVQDVTQLPEWASGIAVRYQAALIYLATRDEIDSENFDVLAAKHHLMPEDLFNAINSWSDETLGDFLLERSEPIRIYGDLMTSILPN